MQNSELLPAKRNRFLAAIQESGKHEFTFEEAMVLLGKGWDSSTEEERKLFPGVSTIKMTGANWDDLRTLEKKFIYEQTFIQVFGDNKPHINGLFSVKPSVQPSIEINKKRAINVIIDSIKNILHKWKDR